MEGRLLHALTMGDTEAVQTLYEENSSILRQKTTEEDTPLHLASRSRSNRTELVSKILRWRPLMAIETNSRKDAPLHDACRVGDLEIVKLLLDAHPCVAYMLNTAKESAFFIACSRGHMEVASELCHRMDFRAWDEIGASCLRIAASKGFTDMVRKILDQNPSSASGKDGDGFSAMHFASREGEAEVINELIRRDPKLSILRDKDERTPLHLAVINKKVAIVNVFLSLSSLNSVQVADLINSADKDGNTVLHLAAINDSLEIIELLRVKQGMNVNAANRNGKTARVILKEKSSNPSDSNSNERASIIRTLKAQEEKASRKSLITLQQTLMVVAALIVTITFQAGLNPPGGVWQDSNGKGQTSYKPGKAIQSEKAPCLFAFFMVSDALAFIVSLVLIPIIVILQKEMLAFVNSLVVVALISVEVSFILGLFMISDRKPFYRVEVFFVVLVTLAGVGWTCWKLKPSLIGRSTRAVGSQNH
ncbi:hypothetical protein AAC387_Pa03g3802 [Persea americana]